MLTRLPVLKRLRLWRAEIRLKRQYLPQIKEARDKGDSNTARDLQQQYLFEMREFSDTRLHWVQQRLIRKARQLHIPVPSQDMNKIEEEFEDDNWDYSNAIGEMLLKGHAMDNLSREVMKEQRQQLGARATWATWMTALATVILAVVTWQYVSLTNRLVKLQIEPSIEAGLDEPIMGSTTFVVQNNGAEPVENVIVNIRCLLFRSPNDPQPTVFFTGLPSDNKRSWWQIGKLDAGEVMRKDSIQSLTGCLVNRENMQKFESQKTKAQAKGGKFQAGILGSIVVFDLSYQREVDRKLYRMSRPAWLYKDGKTGKPVLGVPVISSEYKRFIDELTSGGGKRP